MLSSGDRALRVVILERNKLVARKVARLFAATGATPVLVEEPAALAEAAGDADVIAGDAFDGEAICAQLAARAGMRGVLWTAEPLRRSLGFLAECPAIDDVLARRDFEAAPRAHELVRVARRLAGGGSPPLAAYLDWGGAVHELAVHATADRDTALAEIQARIEPLVVPRRCAELFGELAHELLMNALYDAPADAAGHAKYAADRKRAISLAPDERPVVRFGCDGSRLVLQVRDPFGRLERRHVLDGLARGLAGELDTAGGGAGMGLAVCHHAATALVFDVARGRSTEVTAVLELDLNLRELRTAARSLHVWGA